MYVRWMYRFNVGVYIGRGGFYWCDLIGEVEIGYCN